MKMGAGFVAQARVIIAASGATIFALKIWLTAISRWNTARACRAGSGGGRACCVGEWGGRRRWPAQGCVGGWALLTLDGINMLSRAIGSHSTQFWAQDQFSSKTNQTLRRYPSPARLWHPIYPSITLMSLFPCKYLLIALYHSFFSWHYLCSCTEFSKVRTW